MVPSSGSGNCKLHGEGRRRWPSQEWKSALTLLADKSLCSPPLHRPCPQHGGRPSVVRAQEWHRSVGGGARQVGSMCQNRLSEEEISISTDEPSTILVGRWGTKGPKGRRENSIQRRNSRSNRSGHKRGPLACRGTGENKEETGTERG